MLEEGYWNDEPGYNMHSSPIHSSQVIPTPPRSPTMQSDSLLGFDSPLTNGDMVNPNAVLDESHLFSDSAVGFHSLNLPKLEENLPLEQWNPYLENGEKMDDICTHGFLFHFCNECFEDTIKSEVVSDDIMWTSGLAVKEDRFLSSAQNQLGLLNYDIFSRSRLDSVSSRYSEIIDPLVGAIANMDSAEEMTAASSLETPSDTTDVDSDTEEICPTAEHVHLDHNYHFTHSRYRNDISSPLRKALKNVSTSQSESEDEEIDVDEIDVTDNHLMIRGTAISASPLQTLKSSALNVGLVATVPAKRGRKPGSTSGPRKIGRPSNSSKRLSTKGMKSPSKRHGARSVQMDPEKRKAHNSMERMRRVDLKKCFDDVRICIPTLKERVRAPKVTILQSAVEYLRELEYGVRKLEVEKGRLKQYHQVIAQKLAKLQRERITIDLG